MFIVEVFLVAVVIRGESVTHPANLFRLGFAVLVVSLAVIQSERYQAPLILVLYALFVAFVALVQLVLS